MIFGPAFPLAPLLGFINNLVEMRIDKYKLVYLTKRPVPNGASDIGIWKIFIEIIIYISIVTNAAYLTLTGRVFSTKISTNLQIFVYSVFICWSIKTFVYFIVSETPKRLITIMRRHENILNKLFSSRNSGKTESGAKVNLTTFQYF